MNGHDATNQEGRDASRTWVALVLTIGILLPLALALTYVHRFGVNVPENDDWFFIPTLEAFYSGKAWLPLVLQHYTEHRVIIPKLLILGFSAFNHFDLKFEMYFSVLLMALCALLIWRLIRITATPSWVVIPAGVLLLSLAQAENLLNGWQFCMPLANAFLLGMVVLLSRRSLTIGRYVAAIACAIGATFSFAAGTLAWPLGLFLLFDRMKSPRVFIWIGVSVLVAVLYRWGYQGARDVPPDYLSFWHHPAAAAKLSLAIIGSNFGGYQLATAIATGAATLLLLCGIVLLEPRVFHPRTRPWYALLLYGLLATALVSLGRSFEWQAFALSSRYATLSVLAPVSCVALAAIGIGRIKPAYRQLSIAVCAIGLLFAGVQSIRTALAGWRLGSAVFQERLIARSCLLDFRNAPEACLKRMFANGGEIVRREAAVLEKYDLSPFHDRDSQPDSASRANEIR